MIMQHKVVYLYLYTYNLSNKVYNKPITCLHVAAEVYPQVYNQLLNFSIERAWFPKSCGCPHSLRDLL